jgi:type II secretory pathway pseudopilin PulG
MIDPRTITPGVPARHTSAFSLIELVAVIALITLLIALLAPSLAATRRYAQRSVTLSNLRQHAVAFAAYQADERGAFPLMFNPRALNLNEVSHVDADSNVIGPWRYFDFSGLWNYQLAGRYYSVPASASVFFDAEQGREPSPDFEQLRYSRVPLQYPCVFGTSPLFWNESTRTGASQYGATYAHNVSFPSHKTLIVSIGQTWVTRGDPPQDARIATLFVDGHAAHVRFDNFIPGMPTGENLNPGSLHTSEAYTACHTIDGVRGRDVLTP